MTNEEFIRTCSKEELIKDMQNKINFCWSCGYEVCMGGARLCGDLCVAHGQNALNWLKMEHCDIEDGEAKCES